MVPVIRELLSHLLGKGFGELELILGMPLGFAFWCLQYSISTWRTRRRGSVILIVAAAGIITLLMMPAWDARTLLRIIVSGCLFYLPLWGVGRLHRRGRV